MRRVQPHVLQGFFHYRRTHLPTHKKGCSICMGKRTARGARENHHAHHKRTSPRTTRPLTTIRARDRRITNRNRSNPIPTGPTNKPPRRYSETRTKTSLWFPLPKFHHHRAKLPNL